MSATTRRRRGFAVVVAAILGFASAFVSTTPAQAAISGYIYGGPANAYGFYDYSWTVPYPPGSDWLRIVSQSTTLAAGKCYDMIFDWSRAGHYDARLARSCKAYTPRNSQVSHESPHNLGPAQRLGICYGTNQDTNGAGSVCNFTVGGPSGVVTRVGPNEYCVRAWSMKPDGTYQFFGGGNPIQCGS